MLVRRSATRRFFRRWEGVEVKKRPGPLQVRKREVFEALRWPISSETMTSARWYLR